jgi:energy-coupling factor transport system substrate-specific component
MAAAGHNPRDLHRRGGRSLAAYVARDGASVKDIGEVERTVLVLSAAGRSPRDFGGRDLVSTILAKRRGDGSIAGYVSYTTFGVLALRSAGVSPGKRTVAWLVSAQNDDGGFAVAPSSTSDSDMTGATLQALAVVGRKRGGATQRAVGWLRANQNDDGGFGQLRGRPSNAQSTAYAVQGLVAAGADGATLTRALAYLRGLQRADGSVSYSKTSNQTPVWVTAQALMALDRKPLPIAAVARAPRAHKAKPAVAPAAAPKAKQRQKLQASQTADPSPDVVTKARLVPAPKARADAAALTLDRTNDQPDDSGPPAWVFAVAVVAALGGLFALRRRLVRALWHSHQP